MQDVSPQGTNIEQEGGQQSEITQQYFDAVYHWQTDKEECGANSLLYYQHKNPE